MTVKLHQKPASGTSDPDGRVVSEAGCCPWSVPGREATEGSLAGGSLVGTGGGHWWLCHPVSGHLHCGYRRLDASLPAEMPASTAVPLSTSGEGIRSLQAESMDFLATAHLRSREILALQL